MIKEKYDVLVDKLTKATESGKVVWEKTSSKTEYQTRIVDNAVSVGFFDPNDMVTMLLNSPSLSKKKIHYYLNLYNNKGVQVDNEEREENDEGYSELKKLYLAARRKYLRVDETLNEILNDLG